MTEGYAYLHGFASSPRSKKAALLARVFEDRGVHLHVPDLNRPSFATLTLSAQLDAVDALVQAHPEVTTWRFVGSSMGGWLAARWAELHPERVDRLVLLCPGFAMVERWPKLVGAEGMARWRAHGGLPFPDADGRPTAVHWGFIEDALTQPQSPPVPCPTVIIHGTSDATVPIETSRAYVAAHPLATLVEVDDGHLLANAAATIEARVRSCFGL
ncbi:MAG: YqiA/YcfP family alpha/beta fold hydrolase [Myxococcota bacterium]